MATVAIIHAAEDALPARALAEKLRQARLNVVLEQEPGQALRDAVKSAQVTIALWSPRSVAQPQLTDEVASARSKSKVVHASMQNAHPPEAFRGDKVVNLTGWRGEDDFPAWRDLAKLVTDKAGVAPMPPPAPRAPSGFFQPGAYNPASDPGAGERTAAPQSRPAPQRAQQAQRPPRPAPQRDNFRPEEPESSGGGRGLIIGAIVFVVVALIGAGGYYFWQQGQSAQVTANAWDSIDHNSADALRAFLAGGPGDHRADAERALAELEERSYEAASDSDTIEAFEGFLNDFPESQHALAARGRIAELRTLQPTTTTDTASTSAVPPTTIDPDLLPPTASTAPAPATSTPVPLSPPATEPAPPAAEQQPLPTTTP
jgi:hypothetical protein